MSYIGNNLYSWSDTRKIKFFIFTTTCSNANKKYSKRMEVWTESDNEEKKDVDLCYLLRYFVQNYTNGELDIDEKMRNSNRVELMKHFEDMKENPKLKDYDCFFFIFLTFGSQEGLHFMKDKVQLDEIYSKLDEIECMQNKPKVLLVQADSEGLLEKLHPTPHKHKGTTKVCYMKIPHDADRITIMSCVPCLKLDKLNEPTPSGGPSLPQDELEPSPMIKAFVKVMVDNELEPRKLDLFSLTGKINKTVEEMINAFKSEHTDFKHKDLTVPLVTSTLRKLLFIEKPKSC